MNAPNYHHLPENWVPNTKDQQSHEIIQNILHRQGACCRHRHHSRIGAIRPQIRAIELPL